MNYIEIKSQAADAVPRDHLEVAAVLQEDRPRRLQGVDAHARARDDGRRRWVHLEFLRYEFHAGQEGGFLRN